MSTDAQLKTIKESHSVNIDTICRVNIKPNELDGYGIVPATSNAMFEVIMSMVIGNAWLSTAKGMTEFLHRLKMCHPSGTLQDKVTKVLEDLQED
jgi:hypothetical protein